MPRNIRQATQRSNVMRPVNSDTTQDMPATAISGHRMSPTATPTASGQAAGKPPETERATSANHTGPGVRNSTSKAPA